MSIVIIHVIERLYTMKSLVSIFFLTLWSLSSIECKSFNMKSISQFMKPIFKSTLATSLIATSLAINPIISHAAVGEGMSLFILIYIHALI